MANTLETMFAAKLLNIKAIKLQPENPFTWASGWKSPFYCDNRKTLAFPDLRSFVKLELCRLRQLFTPPRAIWSGEKNDNLDNRNAMPWQ
jgi:orotate phosphoribosyltransferase